MGSSARSDGDPASGARAPTGIAGYSGFTLGTKRWGVRQRTHPPTRGGERISHACATPRAEETSRHRSDSQCCGAGPCFPFAVRSYRTPSGPHRFALPRMGSVGRLHNLHSCGFFPVALSSIAAWGNNDYGQCNPPPGGPNTGLVGVAAGDGHSLAIRSDFPFTAGFIVVDKRRVGRTSFEYQCKVRLKNYAMFAVKNAELNMAGAPSNMTIIDPNIRLCLKTQF